MTFRPPGNEVNESNHLHLPVSRSPPAFLLCGQGADVLPRVWSCRLALQDICKPLRSCRPLEVHSVLLTWWISGFCMSEELRDRRRFSPSGCCRNSACFREHMLKKNQKNNNFSAIWHLKPYFNFWVQLFFLNILWNTSMLPICSNLVSSGLTAVEERSSLTHLKKLDLLTKIVTEGIHCILLTVQVITPHLTISTWGQNPLCSLWSLRNANPTNLSFHFRSGWSLM